MTMTNNPINPQAVSAEKALANTPSELAAKPGARSLRERLMRRVNSGLITFIVVLIAFIWSVPTFGLLVTSFRPAALIQSSGWWSGLLPPWHFTLENYTQVVQAQGVGTAFLNSLIIAIPGTLLPVILASFAAYAFAWMKFPGRDWIFLAIVALLVVPIQMTLVPVLSLYTGLGLTGSYLGIWLAHTAYGMPFAIYLLRSFFGSLPADIFESAMIDGAGHFRIFTRLLLPLATPSLASLVIFLSLIHI